MQRATLPSPSRHGARGSRGRRPTAILADDHPLMLAGLRRLLEPECEVVGTAADGGGLVELAARLRPDLAVADLSMPGMDGIAAARQLQTAAPGVRVIVLTVHGEPSYVRAAFAAGAWGYLLKTSAPEEIERAVREVLAGRVYVSPAVARAALSPDFSKELGAARPAAGERLTRRELEILRLLAAGLGNPAMAERLGISLTTVRTHLAKLYAKLQIESRVELALYATRTDGAAAGRPSPPPPPPSEADEP